MSANSVHLHASPAAEPQTTTQVDYGLSSSPRRQPTVDVSHPILEEGDESESDTPNEPVTPVSGRHSQDFHNLQNHDIHTYSSSNPSSDTSSIPFPSLASDNTPAHKPPVVVNTEATPPPPPKSPNPSSTPAQEQLTPTLSRRSTRGSSSTFGFKRTMSSIFKRSGSQTEKAAFGDAGYVASSDPNLESKVRSQSQEWRVPKSMGTTQSNTQSNSPPSPGSPVLEMAGLKKGNTATATATVPSADDFFKNQKKKNRASTGFSIRNAITFVTSSNSNGNTKPGRPVPLRRRASSFDYSNRLHPEHRGDPWGLPAEAGTGVKARRMSLSLPDDFTVDIVDLHSEFDYMHKMGRHRKHLGKGATSKVTLMFRKGYPEELYAVKEFRGKSSSETKEEYEKKVKSEYSIAKSLHHPNVVETIRLCTDRGRWNHVMEYCQEGDLFSLVQKKYLKDQSRAVDRLCLFKQLVQGLAYLHANGIAHRDIKLENLLITKDSKLKITDFGVSEVFCGIHPGLREAGGQCGQNMADVRMCSPGICGSLPYISPEVLAKQGQYDPRALDVWGAAIVMINLIFGAPLWEAAKWDGNVVKNPVGYAALAIGWKKWNDKNSGDEVSDTNYPKVAAFDFAVNPPVLRRILLQMLNPDPEKRMTIERLVEKRWFKNIECCQLDTYEDPAKYIDASKKSGTKLLGNKIFCHNHLPVQSHGSHSLGTMPGKPGY
ncbi:uncharacterized protein E0L32_005021 [Thyridium curvatum]|uniref:Protein kinase domain-containing protein n=1 Tax=Thyridium curvatum TaxID=1093900 RepID=A0A507AY60_9PEZI|nr:uncharacterized protein E0L32_005021 [Thyridium curvatum]TPX14912.1 hypothetical protein E0L32_005021 [Thyridium curvatum]